MPRARAFVVTFFIDGRPQFNGAQMQRDCDEMKTTFAIGQLERCPTTGLDHWQMYLRFANPMTARGIVDLVHEHWPDAHVEIARGSPQQNITYCTKQESRADPYDFFETGSRPQQGARSDLKSVCDEIAAGMSVADVAHAYPSTYVRNYNGLQHLENMVKPPFEGERVVFVLFGETGAGKTRWAVDMCKRNDLTYAFINNPTTKAHVGWIEANSSTKVLIFDDFDERVWSETQILRLTDEYAVTAKSSSGTFNCCHEVVIFTGRTHPSTWTDWRQLDAFMRRVQRGGGCYQFYLDDNGDRRYHECVHWNPRTGPWIPAGETWPEQIGEDHGSTIGEA